MKNYIILTLLCVFGGAAIAGNLVLDDNLINKWSAKLWASLGWEYCRNARVEGSNNMLVTLCAKDEEEFYRTKFKAVPGEENKLKVSDWVATRKRFKQYRLAPGQELTIGHGQGKSTQRLIISDDGIQVVTIKD